MCEIAAIFVKRSRSFCAGSKNFRGSFSWVACTWWIMFPACELSRQNHLTEGVNVSAYSVQRVMMKQAVGVAERDKIRGSYEERLVKAFW